MTNDNKQQRINDGDDDGSSDDEGVDGNDLTLRNI